MMLSRSIKRIKKSAAKWHPDKNDNSAESTARFQEINQANEVLRDPQKKKKYDDLIYGRTLTANFSSRGTKQRRDFTYQGLSLFIEFMYDGECRFDSYNFFRNFVTKAESSKWLRFDTTSTRFGNYIQYFIKPVFLIPQNAFVAKMTEEFTHQFQAFLINEVVEKVLNELKIEITKAYDGIIAQMQMEDYFTDDNRQEFVGVANRIASQITLMPGTDFNLYSYLYGFDFSCRLARPMINKILEEGKNYDRLFDLIDMNPNSDMIAEMRLLESLYHKSKDSDRVFN